MVVELALAHEALEHRRLGFLGLQEQRLLSVAPKAIQARVPTLPTPTTLRPKSTSSKPSRRC
jgi:hypothetical protein